MANNNNQGNQQQEEIKIGVHAGNRRATNFERMFNDMEMDSYEAELERQRETHKSLQSGSNNHLGELGKPAPSKQQPPTGYTP